MPRENDNWHITNLLYEQYQINSRSQSDIRSRKMAKKESQQQRSGEQRPWCIL